MLKEFREFAFKGNLVDIAVGLVMATAFGSFVNAFVEGIFMPFVGLIFQMGDLNEAKIVVSKAVIGEDGQVIKPESAFAYGNFISTFVNFIIVAFVMYLIIKATKNFKKEEPEATTESLLADIKELLQKK